MSKFFPTVCAAMLIVAAADAAAQNPDDVNPVTTTAAEVPRPPGGDALSAEAAEARAAELQRWADAFTQWKQWWAQWASRPEPGWLTGSRDRREKPAPPAWLPRRCADGFLETDAIAPSCALLAEWREDELTSRLRLARVTAIQKKEDDSRTSWWNHVHLDLLWPATQLRANVFGVVGVHTATTVRGRIQVFLAPGVMLMNLPSLSGGRVWKVAANYGIGYRIGDFGLPGNRRASAHVNIAKSWLTADARDLVSGGNLDFVGLSLTFKNP
jgi:hypothetical protein